MTRGDLVVIFGAALLTAASFAWFWGGGGGEWVEIQTVDGHLERFNLWEARQIEVAGKHGNTLIDIEPGRVRVADSPCDDHICVLAGWLDHLGDTAACVPNGVLVTVAGHGGSRFDAINF